MNKVLGIAAVALVALSSCGGKEKKCCKNDCANTVADATELIKGEWSLDSIVMGDSVKINVKGIESEQPQAMSFDADSTFFVQTNCNTLRGDYTLKGDSIKFGNALSTMMACPDMKVEDALKQVLPLVKTVAFANDSTMTLKADSAYVTMSRPAKK